MAGKYPIDRSLAFTALLELAPEAFPGLAVEVLRADLDPPEPELIMFEYARTWLARGGLKKRAYVIPRLGSGMIWAEEVPG